MVYSTYSQAIYRVRRNKIHKTLVLNNVVDKPTLLISVVIYGGHLSRTLQLLSWRRKSSRRDSLKTEANEVITVNPFYGI